MSNYFSKISVLLSILFLSACVPDNVLTKEELENQDKASRVVTNILFDFDLDTAASYNIRKDGLVVIKFAQSVPESKFTKVVEMLRKDSNIKGLRAEQGGVEVCPLRP